MASKASNNFLKQLFCEQLWNATFAILCSKALAHLLKNFKVSEMSYFPWINFHKDFVLGTSVTKIFPTIKRKLRH